MVTAVQLDVALIAGSYAGLDQLDRGPVDHMIMNCPIDQQRLINTIQIAAYVGPEEGLGIQRAKWQSVVPSLILTRLFDVVDDARE